MRIGVRLEPLAAATLFLVSCSAVSPRAEREAVSAELAARGAAPLSEGARPGEAVIPCGITLEDGLTAEECVALGLANNARFLEALESLERARADVFAAGLPADPVFSLLFPLGPKQLEFALRLPFEALWIAPKRVEAAELDADAVAASLVADGLDLVRDVRVAVAALDGARRLEQATHGIAESRTRLESLAASRMEAGETAPGELAVAREIASAARAAAAGARGDVRLAELRLRALVGFARDPRPLVFVDGGFPVVPALDEEALLAEALCSRPEVRAAELGFEAAAARAELAGREPFTASAVLDANGEGADGFEAGPGLDATLPLLNANRGGRARAAAGVSRAGRHLESVSEAVASEVRVAFVELRRAVEVRAARESSLATLEEEKRRMRAAFEAGEVSLVEAVSAEVQLSEAARAAAGRDAAVAQALAALSRAVGRDVTRVAAGGAGGEEARR